MSVFIFFILILATDGIYAQPISFQGQASGWLGHTKETEIGFRYIPEIRAVKSLGEEKSVDAKIAVNSYILSQINSLTDVENNSDLRLYRLWLRYSSSQFETRVGLQKINFGPAKNLRSLMWFDQLDPRDPLKLTDGVYGVLMRYYFLNNANVWVWGLLGNDRLKGLEFVKTDKEHLELGGRFQFPLSKGELAISCNRRKIDDDGWENRLAVDGIWDIGVSLWFEAFLEEAKIKSNQRTWRELVTIGTDYTLMSGVHLLYEHLIQHQTGSKIDQMDRTGNISALSADYAIGIIDRLNAIFYYNWTQKESYFYAGWQRAYDNWKIDLVGFSNREDSATFSGKGVQCIVTYNH